MFRAFMRAMFLSCAFCVFLLTAFAQDSVPLGDVARQNRAHSPKKPEKVYTNDDIAPVTFSNGAVQGETGNAALKAAASSTSPADSKPVDDKSASAEKTADKLSGATKNGEADKKDDKAAAAKRSSPEDRIRTEYAAKKDELSLLQRELNVVQQEYDLQTAHYYADAAAALRDPKEWASKRKDYEDQIAEKQKQVQEATQALADIEEQGRKAGLPSSDFQ
jgi:hypothetical protein